MTLYLTCVQVQQKDLSDEAIARAVCVKVGDSPGVSYSDIAAKAYECGRTELAIKVDFPETADVEVLLRFQTKCEQMQFIVMNDYLWCPVYPEPGLGAGFTWEELQN